MAAATVLALVPVLILLLGVEIVDGVRTQRRAADLRAAAAALLGSAAEVEAGQRGYLQSGDPSNLRPILGARDRLPEVEQSLNALVFDDPAQGRRAAAVVALIEGKVEAAAETVALLQRGAGEEANARFQADQKRGALAAIRGAVLSLERGEERVLADGRAERRGSAALTAAAAAALVLGSVLTMTWARRSPALLERLTPPARAPADLEPEDLSLEERAFQAGSAPAAPRSRIGTAPAILRAADHRPPKRRPGAAEAASGR